MINIKLLLSLFQISYNPNQIDDLQILSHLRTLLTSIHPTLFQSITNLDFQKISKQQLFLQIISSIGNYLNVIQYKRLNKDFQKDIISRYDINKLAGLGIYVSINGNIDKLDNKQMVDIILGMDQEQQKQIMKNMSEIDTECQDLIQIKNIGMRICALEEQNQVLKQNINNQNHSIIKQTKDLNDIQKQQEQLLKCTQQYQKNKNNLLKQLKFNNIQDYILHCHQMKDKNNNLIQKIKMIKQNQINHLDYNKKMKQELKNKAKIIENKIKYIELLKKNSKQHNLANYSGLKETDNHFNIPLLPLQQNNASKNVLKNLLSNRSKMETDRTACTSIRQDCQDQEQKNNLQKLLTLKKLQLQQAQKIKFIEVLKRKHEFNLLKDKELKDHIKCIKIYHRKYMNSYGRLNIQ